MILNDKNKSGHRISLFLILCLFGIIAAQSSYRTDKNRNRRAGGERIYLEHADELTFDINGNHPDAQVLRGNVKFRHKGAVMTCDSAFFYQDNNSFDAFSNVVITQGDSVRLVSDFANYNGNDEMAEARNNVILTHRKSKLYTDYLNYDKLYSRAFFYDGGKLIDKDNTLTSDWGEYDLESHDAVFNYDVKLDNPRFDLFTDTLHYNTNNKVATIVGSSVIYTGTRVIETKAGRYDTEKKLIDLLREESLEDFAQADSSKTGRAVADSADTASRFPQKTTDDKSFNVIVTDTVNKNILKCNYLHYEEDTEYALASDNPLMMEYSQGDTLYMHSDTIKMFTYNIKTDSVYRKVLCYNKAKAYRHDVQTISDSLVYNTSDSCLTLYKNPIAWYENKQLTGKKILVFLEDSTLRKVDVIDNAIAAEDIHEENRYNQISSKYLYSYFEEGDLKRNDAIDNVIAVFYQKDDKDSSTIMMHYIETDTMRVYINERKLDKIWTSKAVGTVYPLTQIPPGKNILKGFEWYYYLRPTDKDDIFIWREKKDKDLTD